MIIAMAAGTRLFPVLIAVVHVLVSILAVRLRHTVREKKAVSSPVGRCIAADDLALPDC